MGQEECVPEHQEQISSLKTQLEEMQQMLQQVQQKHQVEVSGLQDQLTHRAGQVGSETTAEIQDAARQLTTQSSLLKPNGDVMLKSEALEQFLADSRNVSMAQPEEKRFSEVIKEIIAALGSCVTYTSSRLQLFTQQHVTQSSLISSLRALFRFHREARWTGNAKDHIFGTTHDLSEYQLQPMRCLRACTTFRCQQRRTASV